MKLFCNLLQLAGALIKQNAPDTTAMAIIPMGTANDFATGAGIPQDPWEALQLAVHDTAHSVDVGLCNEQVHFLLAILQWKPWLRGMTHA